MDPKQEWIDDITGETMRAKWDEDCMVVRNIGALVRLVREIIKKADEMIQAGDDVEPDIIAWLSEARALVGEVTDER